MRLLELLLKLTGRLDELSERQLAAFESLLKSAKLDHVLGEIEISAGERLLLPPTRWLTRLVLTESTLEVDRSRAANFRLNPDTLHVRIVRIVASRMICETALDVVFDSHRETTCWSALSLREKSR